MSVMGGCERLYIITKPLETDSDEKTRGQLSELRRNAGVRKLAKMGMWRHSGGGDGGGGVSSGGGG